MGEHRLCKAGVEGSSPSVSIFFPTFPAAEDCPAASKPPTFRCRDEGLRSLVAAPPAIRPAGPSSPGPRSGGLSATRLSLPRHPRPPHRPGSSGAPGKQTSILATTLTRERPAVCQPSSPGARRRDRPHNRQRRRGLFGRRCPHPRRCRAPSHRRQQRRVRGAFGRR